MLFFPVHLPIKRIKVNLLATDTFILILHFVESNIEYTYCLTNTENKTMNENIILKEPNTREFNLAFDNFYKANPALKNEPMMYMCTSNGYDYFKHSVTRENYKAIEGGK